MRKQLGEMEENDKRMQVLLKEARERPAMTAQEESPKGGYYQTVTKQKKKRCESCGVEVAYNSFSNHTKSKIHLKLLEKKT